MNFMWGFSLFILFDPHTPDVRILWGIHWWSRRQPAEARGAAILEAKHLTSWQLMFNEAPRRGAAEKIPLDLRAAALAVPRSTSQRSHIHWLHVGVKWRHVASTSSGN